MIKKKRVIPLFLLGVLVFSLFVSDVTACANGPNYWGDGYPGYPTGTDAKYRNPEEPSKYIIASKEKPDSQTYDGSHYGTHDWIADAALRSLRDTIKNPLGFEDWTWVINSEISTNKWPVWNSNYGNDAQRHNKIRSYFTYLFATQMPDMKPKFDTPPEDLDHYPQVINIPMEGVVIKDLNEKWVGLTDKHTFHFKIYDLGDGHNGFIPDEPQTPSMAILLGKEAIDCIGNQAKDEQGIYTSAMQPEGAAGWFGAMAHYIADMVVPAHLLKIDSTFYTRGYHTWFEKQLASLTKWNKSYGAHGGPETKYFSWNIDKIGLTGLIEPISPDIATTIMAIEAIRIAFRTDGNDQHIIRDGHNDEESMKGGLFLNNSEEHWDWKVDLDTYGRDESPHKYFYDKVEKLLCWATYFIACAMQYCLNEGKKKLGNDQNLNPDYYVTREPIPHQPPNPHPRGPLDDYLYPDLTGTPKDKFKRLFKNLGWVIGPLITGIGTMLGRMFHIIGR